MFIHRIYSELGEESLESAVRKEMNVDHLSVLRQVAFGLQHLHKAEIHHGNLKPTNIILNKDVAKLTDIGFGCVFAEDQLTKSNFVTINRANYRLFSAPEIIMGLMEGKSVADFGLTGDVYSLGVVAIWTQMGEIPFSLNQLIISEDFEPASVIGDENVIVKAVLPFIARNRNVRPNINRVVEILNDVKV